MGTDGKSQDDRIQAVLTCQGDIDDPDFPEKCQRLFNTLSQVLENKDLDVTKCEPWNSVKVTFNIPKDAAEKLARLAEAGDDALRELGILSIQVEGGQVISMTMAQEDSDSDTEVNLSSSQPQPSSATGASKTIGSSAAAKIPPTTDEKAVVVKQEPQQQLISLSRNNAVIAGGGRSPAAFTTNSGSSSPLKNNSTAAVAAAAAAAAAGIRNSVAAAMLMKNFPTTASGMSAAASATLLASAADPSVLSNLTGAGLLPGGKEGGGGGSGSSSIGSGGLLASLMSSKGVINSTRNDSSSHLVNLMTRGGSGVGWDSDEPVLKKPRKQQDAAAATGFKSKPSESLPCTATSSSSGVAKSGFPNSSKVSPGGGGFTLHPVTCTAAAASSRTSSSGAAIGSHSLSTTTTTTSSSTTEGRGVYNNPAASSVRLASLPGVSLTAVSPRTSSTDSASPSTGGGGGTGGTASQGAGLMPPPTSSVTLSPVPRTNLASSDSSNGGGDKGKATTISETDKGKLNSSAVLSSSPLNKPSPQPYSVSNKGTLLINPVTGQFEIGPAAAIELSQEAVVAAAAAAAATREGEDVRSESQQLTSPDLHSPKHKSEPASPVQSPGSGTTTSVEPSLKLKLKVSSLPNNSAKSGKEAATSLSSQLVAGAGNKLLPGGGDGCEPKVPKIKIKLKDKIVKLEGSNSENADSNTALNCVDPSKLSESPVQLDLKTKVKIRHLGDKGVKGEEGGSRPGQDKGHPNNVTNYKANLNISHIVADTDSKKSKKGGGAGGGGAGIGGVLKDKKNGKDRLAIWTESLAKHGQREGEAANSGPKETKSWPEVLESRLFTNSTMVGTAAASSGNSTSGLSFTSKAEALDKQTDPVGERKSSTESGDAEDQTPTPPPPAATPNHLNWTGPGRHQPPIPGPGPALPPSQPTASHPSSNQTNSSPERGDQQPQLVSGAKEKTETTEFPGGGTKELMGGTSVLDILEGRRPLGDPNSPQGGSQDNGGQQGEDSGIESMDTLSEKSPNQGESPFHAAIEPCLAEGSRGPTYSSSMGLVVGSGKLSPPVSDSGSTDSLAASSTPPDKSPSSSAATTTAPSPMVNHHVSGAGVSLALSTGGESAATKFSPVVTSNTSSSTITLVPSNHPSSGSILGSDSTHADAQKNTTSTNSFPTSFSSVSNSTSQPSTSTVTRSTSNSYSSSSSSCVNNSSQPKLLIDKPLSNCDPSKSTLTEESVTNSDSPTGGGKLVTSSSLTQSDALNPATTNHTIIVERLNPQVVQHISNSAPNHGINVPVENGERNHTDNGEETETRLLTNNLNSSTSINTSGDFLEINTVEMKKITNDMKEYANLKTANKTSNIIISNNVKSGFNNLMAVSNSTATVLAVSDEFHSAVSSPGAALKSATLLARRPSLEVGGAVGLIAGGGSSPPPGLVSLSQAGRIGSNGAGSEDLPAMQQLKLPVSLSSVQLGQVRSGLPIRPGAKMVPVKLVTVPGGAGNVRMLRVSPVKGDIVGTTIGTTGTPPRTVVFKSTSLLKAVSCSALSTISLESSRSGEVGGGDLTTSLVQYPAPVPQVGDKQQPPVEVPSSATSSPSSSICDKSPSTAIAAPSQPTVSHSSIVSLHQQQRTISSAAATVEPRVVQPPSAVDDSSSTNEQLLPPATNCLSSITTSTPPSSQLNCTVVQNHVAESSLPRSESNYSNSVDNGLVKSNFEPSEESGGVENADISPLGVDVTNSTIVDELMESMPSPAVKATRSSSVSDVQQMNGELTSLADDPIDANNRRRARNGKKSSGDSQGAEPDTGSSLLKPLLGKPDTGDELVVPTSPGSPILPGKRSRRNTGSSVQSDRSDLSVSDQPAAKRAREEAGVVGKTGGRKATGSPGLKENTRKEAGDVKRAEGVSGVKEKMKVDSKIHDNGTVAKKKTVGTENKTAVSTGATNKIPAAVLKAGGGVRAAPSPDPKKVGRLTAVTKEAPKTVPSGGPIANTTSLGPGGGVTGVGATLADQGRRVSTRSKKPEDNSVVSGGTESRRRGAMETT